MNCRELVEFLDDYYDGRLEPETAATFDEHLRDCACCEEFLRQYRFVIQAAAALKESPAAPPPPPELVRAILASTAAALH